MFSGIATLKETLMNYQGLGSSYLNVEFGWLPFISDFTKLLLAVDNASQIAHQMARDSGRIVRRSTSLPVTLEQTADSFEASFQGVGANSFIHSSLKERASGELYTSSRKTEHIYFKGAYSYYLNAGTDALSRLDRYSRYANRILGSDLTPEVLWQLTPWSWLIDWVADVGTVVSNIEALRADSLVIRYGYLMRHVVAENTVTVSGLKYKGLSPGPVTLTFKTEGKERVRATPYGFGVDPSLWTPQRWAILTALGAAKSPLILRTA